MHAAMGDELDAAFGRRDAPAGIEDKDRRSDDEQDVYWKLYSDDRDWSWPAGESTYLTPGFGIDQYQTITCEFEEWICFGAETSGGLVYGVGLDFGADCSDCCFRCESGQIDLGFLTCN